MENHLSWLTQDLTEVPAGDDWLSERERELLAGAEVSKTAERLEAGTLDGKMRLSRLPARYPHRDGGNGNHCRR